MKKNIIIYGLIGGVIVSALMLYMVHNLSYCGGQIDLKSSMILGYASMLIAFSLVFVGIRNYRDKYNGGVINFGNAFKIGILITLIASTVYVISWLINYFYFMPDFMEKYSSHALSELKASGAGPAKVADEIKDMAEFSIMYNNPLFNALMTYMEILPVGLIVTLISSLILKRKQPNT